MSKSFFTQEQLEKARQIDSAYALKILEVCVEYDDQHVEIPSTSHWLRKYVAGADPDYVRCIAIPHGEWEFIVIVSVVIGMDHCRTMWLHEDVLAQEKFFSEDPESPIHSIVSMKDLYHAGTKASEQQLFDSGLAWIDPEAAKRQKWHTRGRVMWREQGDANEYCLVTTSGRWLFAFKHNGEGTDAQQRANVERIAALWNAGAGLLNPETDLLDSSLLRLLADIRAAAGDPSGRLMQDELVDHIRQLHEARATWALRESEYSDGRFESLSRDADEPADEGAQQ